MTALILNLSSLVDRISDRELELLSRDNPGTRLETDCHGHLISMSVTGSETSERNSDLLIQIGIWNKQSKLGKVFDSSGGFKLSNGAVRSPDVSWVRIDTWNSLSKELRKKYAPIDPDFVLELMSPTDSLDEVQNKMTEYMECGVRLGWLINPDDKQVEIYRQGKNTDILDNPQTLLGEDIMSNLIVNLSEIFA
ncbi:MAG: Uma2 family endonuclease [Cyanobacteria bacterium J06621_8]